MEGFLRSLLQSSGLPDIWTERLLVLSHLAFLFLIALLVSLVARFLLRRVVQKAVKRTSSQWDDILLESGLFRRLSFLFPPIAVMILLPFFFPYARELSDILGRLLVAYIIVMIAHSSAAFLDSVNEIYRTVNADIARKKPIKGYLQMVKIFVWIVGAVLSVTTVLQVSPVGVLSGLGAMSAVILLVFKDSIMGFVSSMQLSANDMVRIGDWIEMPKYGADGDVIDITLQSIKVRNWDLTITTIPIYALISDSFKNWRGMSESQGRRIKRSIRIDMQSVRFLTDSDIARLSRLRLLSGYLANKQREIAEHNRALAIPDDDMVSGRHLTNLGTFRAYVEAYLADNPAVQQEMLHMVRYLEPGAEGIPLELYLFSADKNWVSYENVQADILDHLLAVLPEFGLRVFQNPSGQDIRELARPASD